jgi:hypothetical protein
VGRYQSGDRTMNATCARWVWPLLAIGSVALLAAGPPVSRRAKEAKMIDALASRNKAPRLIKLDKDEPGKRTDALPLFPANYDWKEQRRVEAALNKVAKETTREMWEELVKNLGDKRYSMTLKFADDDLCLVDSHWTVGEFCREIALHELREVWRRHLPTVHGRQIPLHGDGGYFELGAWRQKRKDKALFQLQIESCEWALAALTKVRERDFDEESPTKAQAMKRIKAEINSLRKTKRPVILECTPTPGLEFYTPKHARTCREMIRKLKLKG